MFRPTLCPLSLPTHCRLFSNALDRTTLVEPALNKHSPALCTWSPAVLDNRGGRQVYLLARSAQRNAAPAILGVRESPVGEPAPQFTTSAADSSRDGSQNAPLPP